MAKDATRISRNAPVCPKEHAITSDDALVLDEMPGSSIVIVGAGYISVEFSSIYKGLGADCAPHVPQAAAPDRVSLPTFQGLP